MILKYALTHDLVEVYAGDTDVHRSSEEYRASKTERERRAWEQITSEYPDFSELSQTITEYESKADDESKFVYLIDKILPVINTYLSNHSYYKDSNVTFERWSEWVSDKEKSIELKNPYLQDLLTELRAFLKQHQKEVFA